MSSQVSKDTVKLTKGIDLPNTVVVQQGADGAFFPANQIGWGESTFDGSTFGGTTEGLLNAVENSIKTTTGKLAASTLTITDNLKNADTALREENAELRKNLQELNTLVDMMKTILTTPSKYWFIEETNDGNDSNIENPETENPDTENTEE